MRKSEAIILFIIILSIALAIALWPRLPQAMVSHWNSQGEPNGYLPRFWGLFIMPLTSFILFLFFIFIPKIDPLKKNIEKFRKYFDALIVLIVVFLFYIYTLSLIWNLGWRFNMSRLMVPAIGFLYYYIGLVLGKAKRNWFIGIRTPWTLSSDNVWDKTHRLGAKLFKASGIIAFLGLAWPAAAIYLVIAPVIISAIFLTFYSYFLFRKRRKTSIG